MLETQLHLVNGIVALLAAAIPIYLTIRLNNNLRKLTVILSIFVIIHAVHSWLGFFGFDFLSDGVFEPLSAAVLLYVKDSKTGTASLVGIYLESRGSIRESLFLMLL